MPYCSECGKDYQDTAKFCPHCGAPNTLSSSNNSSTGNTEHEHIYHKTDAPEFQTVKRSDSSSYGAYRLEDLPEGFVIDERYEVKRKLGQGGFGAVYLAFDRKMAIDKALKIIPDSVASDKEAMSDLQTEARTMVALNHENIVRVFDVHDTGTIKYIDMEYVAGKALNEVKLDYKDKKLPEDHVKKIAVKIANGLAYAHKNNVIHKDIKPQNIMLKADGSIKIMDFGISETVRTSMSRVANSSSSGTLVYMAPEQVRGQNIGKESDIYAFGALLYELLSGHPPFYKGSIEYQIFNEKPDDLTGISPGLNLIIQKCLEKDYKDRFGNFMAIGVVLKGKDISKEVQPLPEVSSTGKLEYETLEIRSTGNNSDLEKELQYDIDACMRLLLSGKGTGGYIEDVYDDRLNLWRQASELGIPSGQYLFARCNNDGFGVDKNLSKALSLYRKAADQGFSLAQNNLGLMYNNGEGVTMDKAEAVLWYRKAAVQGLASAQNNLGKRYDTGEGVATDKAEAVLWYRKAAEQGDVSAQFNLGVKEDVSKSTAISKEIGLKNASWFFSIIIGIVAGLFFFDSDVGWGSAIATCISFLGVFSFFRLIILMKRGLLLQYKKTSWFLGLFTSFINLFISIFLKILFDIDIWLIDYLDSLFSSYEVIITLFLLLPFIVGFVIFRVLLGEIKRMYDKV